MAEDAAFWGIPPEALPDEDQEGGIWPQNVAAVQAWFTVCNQWRTTGGGEMGAVNWLGLDYAAARAGFAMSEVKMDGDLWDQVRLIEAGACAALNGNEAMSEDKSE